MPETRMQSFLNRMKLTTEFTTILLTFLQQYGFKTCGFGYEQILRGDQPRMRSMRSLLRKLRFKESPTALMVKFSPDIICAYPKLKSSDSLFFLDVKTSITPLFFGEQIKRVRRNARLAQLRREDIGEIEREAWYVYNTFYPSNKTAIVMALPYNPKLVVADWVSNVKCLWCYKKKGRKGPIPWNCRDCPIFNKSGTFGVVQNFLAGGSKTPHTNIHLGRMRTLHMFLSSEFGVDIEEDEYNEILNSVKTWQLSKPPRTVNWTQFNNAITELRATCPWLKHRWPEDTSSTRLDSFAQHPQT